MVVDEGEEVVVAVVGLEDEVVEVEDRDGGLAEVVVVLHVVEEAGVAFLRGEEEDLEEVDLLHEVVDVVDSRSRFCTGTKYYATMEHRNSSRYSVILLRCTCK